MVDVLPLLAAVGVIVLWCLGLYGLQRRGLLEPHGLQPSPPPAGPFLMWKTIRGRELIDRLAKPKRFWRVFGDLAIVLVALTMFGTTVLLAWEATLVQNAAIRSNPPSPETLLGLPGINPIIPLGYGILGLAVTLILTSVAPVHDGVGVVGFTANSPAALAGMQPNTVITSINNTEVHSYNEFVAALAAVQVNTTIPVWAYNPATGQNTSYRVTPVERSPTTGRAVLGIYAFDVSTDYYHPLTNPDKFGGVSRSILAYVSLPFSGYSPIDDPATHFYQIRGPAAVIPAPVFWLLANALYWLFWLNLMLGATNALPAVPLDRK